MKRRAPSAGLIYAVRRTRPKQEKHRVFGRLPGKILATGADYLGFQFAGADYLASAIRRGRLPGPAKRWGRIPGPNFRQKAGQITWAGRLPGPRPKAGQNTCLHVFRSVATQAPNRTKPVLGVFLRAAWPGMTNGRGKGRRGPGKGGKEIVGSSSQIGPPPGSKSRKYSGEYSATTWQR